MTRWLGAALALVAGAGIGLAQDQPTIKLMVGFAAGGGSDAIARMFAERLQSELSAPVIS